METVGTKIVEIVAFVEAIGIGRIDPVTDAAPRAGITGIAALASLVLNEIGVAKTAIGKFIVDDLGKIAVRRKAVVACIVFENDSSNSDMLSTLKLDNIVTDVF